MSASAVVAGHEMPRRICDGADFDLGEYLSRAALSGLVDGKAGTCSIWYRPDGDNGSGGGGSLLTMSVSVITPRFAVSWGGPSDSPANCITVQGRDTGGTFRMLMQTGASIGGAAGSGWHHVLASWNTDIGQRHLYVDDVSNKAGADMFDPGANIDYTNSCGVGAVHDGGLPFNGCLAEVFFHPTYLNISIVANRRRFRSSSGKPVFLGANGELPLGVQPLLYLKLNDGEAVSGIATNAGSGGNFSVTGTIATASTSPSD